jgi:hypothetical protein
LLFLQLWMLCMIALWECFDDSKNMAFMHASLKTKYVMVVRKSLRWSYRKL